MREKDYNLDPLDPDPGPKFSFDLSAPAPEVPFEIPPLEGLEATDPSTATPPIERNPTYADTRLSSPAMIGTYDSWAGVVNKVYDTAADKTWGQIGVIEVRRASPYWSAAATPVLGLDEIPPAEGQPQRSTESAFPFPAIDQQAYRVAEGDPVVVVTGRDGKCYYLPDDRPFIGVVAQGPGSASTKEANFGGAGNTTIKVTRQLLTGDPTDNSPAIAFTPMTVTYSYVYPLVPAGQHHGHRVGSTVLCFRRGMYMFCLPARGIWHGKIVAAGPASEANFTDERYWVEILTVNVAYTGDTNVWDWEADGASPFTVQAANASEISKGTHGVAIGTEVIVTLMADSGKDPYFVFTHGGKGVEWGTLLSPPAITGSLTTVKLTVTDPEGVPVVPAETIYAYIRNDQTAVNVTRRDWVAGTTLLSFVRSDMDSLGQSAVLVGEGWGDLIFPVNLSVSSSTMDSHGDATTQCGYEYDVADALTSKLLAGDGTDPYVAPVNPIASPHKWSRPTVGYMIAATYGYACYDANGVLSIGWINEVADQEACSGDETTIDQGSYD